MKSLYRRLQPPKTAVSTIQSFLTNVRKLDLFLTINECSTKTMMILALKLAALEFFLNIQQLAAKTQLRNNLTAMILQKYFI